MDELTRIQQTGRKTSATVVTRGRPSGSSPTSRSSLTFEVEGRRVVFEHVYGPRHMKHYKPGEKVEIWVDPANPDAIVPN